MTAIDLRHPARCQREAGRIAGQQDAATAFLAVRQWARIAITVPKGGHDDRLDWMLGYAAAFAEFARTMQIGRAEAAADFDRWDRINERNED